MAGQVILRSYLDLSHGALENTVDVGNDRNPLVQEHSSMRKFTQVVGKCDSKSVTNSDENSDFVFVLTGITSEEKTLDEAVAEKLKSDSPVSTPANSLVYHKELKIAKYLIDFGEDISNPRYLSFFNLDTVPVYICKKLIAAPDSSDEDDDDASAIYTYYLTPFLKIPPQTSVGPIVFNPRWGNLFVAFSPEADENTEITEHELYVIAYNK